MRGCGGGDIAVRDTPCEQLLVVVSWQARQARDSVSVPGDTERSTHRQCHLIGGKIGNQHPASIGSWQWVLLADKGVGKQFTS